MDADLVTLIKKRRFDEALAALAAGADPESRKAPGESALLWSVIHHRADIASALLAAGAHPSPRTNGKRAAGLGVGGATPLHIAASDGELGLVEILLRGGATVDARDALGNTPLVLATMGGHLDAVRKLIAAGVNANSSGLADFTALHMAAKDGREDLVVLLLQSGASVNPIQDDPSAPLRHAVVNAQKAVAGILRKAGSV